MNAQLLRHDPGPSVAWSQFFAEAPIDHYVNHPAGRFRLDFGPVYYRGRLDGSARVLIVGQDPSTNELLAHRVFVGRSGQRIQRVLQKLGITRSYIMLNTFLFSVFGQFNTELRNIADEPTIAGYRHTFLDRIVNENPIEAVIAFGRGAQHACKQWPNRTNLPIFNATHPAADEEFVIPNWNEMLPNVQAIVQPDEDGVVDTTLFGPTLTDADLVPIPSFDLPFGVPSWHVRDGGHSRRDGDKRIVWSAP
ncbi:MAG: uracil-DNA glycosylase family protein [Chloroflexota bacterium]